MKTWEYFCFILNSSWTQTLQNSVFKYKVNGLTWRYILFLYRGKFTFKVFVKLLELMSVYILYKNMIFKYTGLLNVLSKYNIL